MERTCVSGGPFERAMTKAKRKKKINPVLLDFNLIAGCGPGTRIIKQAWFALFDVFKGPWICSQDTWVLVPTLS